MFGSSRKFGVLFRRVPCYIGDLRRDPNLENFPNARRLGLGLQRSRLKGLRVWDSLGRRVEGLGFF